jgi:flagellar L-ring protein precursor FlgH
MNGTPILQGGIDNESAFNGNGAAAQSNKLDGFISVTVAKRFSNGNLLVRGQKLVAINAGREFVRLQGIVRPSDIAPDNTVLSWRVADAYISYGGQGTVANASKPGWLYRFFNSPHTPF